MQIQHDRMKAAKSSTRSVATVAACAFLATAQIAVACMGDVPWQCHSGTSDACEMVGPCYYSYKFTSDGFSTICANVGAGWISGGCVEVSKPCNYTSWYGGSITCADTPAVPETSNASTTQADGSLCGGG